MGDVPSPSRARSHLSADPQRPLVHGVVGTTGGGMCVEPGSRSHRIDGLLAECLPEGQWTIHGLQPEMPVGL